MAKRIGLRTADEKPSLRTRHRAAHDDDAQGAAGSGYLAGEVDLVVDASAVATQVQGRPSSHTQGEFGDRLEGADSGSRP